MLLWIRCPLDRVIAAFGVLSMAFLSTWPKVVPGLQRGRLRFFLMRSRDTLHAAELRHSSSLLKSVDRRMPRHS
jgi:hypothetical protein